MNITFLHRTTGDTLYSCNAKSRREALEMAVMAGTDLRWCGLVGADLQCADLRGGKLGGADLRESDLRGADLTSAELSGADLRGADLTGADLRGARLVNVRLAYADLRGADLSADLRGADLSGADLTRARLRHADLTNARLRAAYFDPIREDLAKVLSASAAEVPALLVALREGRVDGSTYSGTCACLIGTIARARGVDYNQMEIKPDSWRPAERWFLAIKTGDTPQCSQVVAITVEWVEEWQRKHATTTV